MVKVFILLLFHGLHLHPLSIFLFVQPFQLFFLLSELGNLQLDVVDLQRDNFFYQFNVQVKELWLADRQSNPVFFLSSCLAQLAQVFEI